MAPVGWIDAAATPRRVAALLFPRHERAANRFQHALRPETIRIARLIRALTAPWRRLRGLVLDRFPALIGPTWWVRQTIWSAIWGVLVLYRLRPKRPPVPISEPPIDLISAPDSAPDFAAPACMVPGDVPLAESTVFGEMAVEILHFLQDLYPIDTTHQPPASWDPAERLAQTYPPIFRAIRRPPRWHPDLARAAAEGRLLAVLAVGGPFAKYLERVGDDDYRIDLSFHHEFPVRPGLARIGCIIHYRREGRGLEVTAVDYGGRTTVPGDPEWEFVERVALCTLVTHTLVWRHGMQYHVGGVAPVAVVTHNLPPRHPIRRLLAAHTAETISTNFFTELTLRRSGFDVTGLSFDPVTINHFYDAGARHFDLRRLDVPGDAERRGLPGDLDYPYLAHARRYWDLIEAYVAAYVAIYYPDDESLAADAAARTWFDALDRHFTRGIRYYVPELTVAGLVRFCTVFIYAVTVEHEQNTMWDYAAFLPTKVPADGGPQSVGEVQLTMNFQVLISLATNRLMHDFSHLALDERAAAVMRRFTAELAVLQAEVAEMPDTYWQVVPATLEASVSA